MNRVVFFFAWLTVFLIVGNLCNAQFEKPKEKPVFFIVEEMPEFPGGEAALRQHLAMSISYPAKAKENGIEGRVYISFVVDETGAVTDATVARGVDITLDQEALRVVGDLPKWQPGRQRGENVKVAYTVPINFVLSDKGSSAVDNNERKTVTVETVRQPKNSEGIVMPRFPSGEAALMAYLANNLVYPKDAAKDGVQGKVLVQFLVDKDGYVSGAAVVKGVHELLDAEALRVISQMPKWIPGSFEGEPVQMNLVLPVQFALK